MSKPKFKSGDRVRVSMSSRGNSRYPQIGATGTVVDYDQTIFPDRPIVTVQFDHNKKQGCYHDYRFELI